MPNNGPGGDHYGQMTPMPIDVIEAWGLDFRYGSILKYLARAGRNPLKTTLQELRQARWYLDRIITDLEKTDVEECARPRDESARREPPEADSGALSKTLTGMPGPREGVDPSWPTPVPHREEAGRPVLTWETIDPRGGRGDSGVPLRVRSGELPASQSRETGPPPSEAERDEAFKAQISQELQELQELETKEQHLIERYHDIVGRMGVLRQHASKPCR
jgi:hypothetical protein